LNVRKVLWLLTELNIDYRRLDYGRGFQSTDSEFYRSMNPTGLVPTLDDEGFFLWESNSILRYIASKYGDDRIYPADLQARARCDQWMDWQISTLHPAMAPGFWELTLKQPRDRDQDAIDRSCRATARHLAMLEDCLARSSPFILGADFTLADIALGVSVNRWFCLDISKRDFPGLLAFRNALRAREGFRTHVETGLP